MAFGAGEDESALERHNHHARKGHPPGLVLPWQLRRYRCDPVVEAPSAHLTQLGIGGTKAERDGGNRAAPFAADAIEPCRRCPEQTADAVCERLPLVAEMLAVELVGLAGMDAQGLGDELRFASREKVINGPNRCTAARDQLFDPRTAEAPLAEQGFGSGDHSLAAGGRGRRRHEGAII
jgi:hypothetical protein